MKKHALLHFSEEIDDAIHQNQPIVILDSTLISNEMLYPDNLKTTQLVEKKIRSFGAIPAIIMLYQGKIHIGMDEHIMQQLFANEVVLASRRDLAYVLSKQLIATTTVAASLFCANLANLPVLVTGGLGGMPHALNGAHDIHMDLIELSSTPMTVICSGAKSILDLPKTLEILETQGIAVLGFQTDEFPAFFSHSSGIPLSHRLDSAAEIASLMHYHRKLNILNGIVIANPIPKSAEIPDSQISPIIKQAQLETQHLNGKAITPFLLKRIAELTAGQSLHANIELITNNAALGAAIACEYHKKYEFFS